MLRIPAIGAVLCATALLIAQDPRPVFTDDERVAVRGHDVVAFFSASAAVVGRREFQVEHGGAVYRFASAEHRDRFVAEPERYLPQYGGFCAVGVAYGGRYPVDIATWRIIDGRLYLNKNAEVRRIFDQDTAALVRKADERWPQVAAGR
jgi:YHS domain-containing protein